MIMIMMGTSNCRTSLLSARFVCAAERLLNRSRTVATDAIAAASPAAASAAGSDATLPSPSGTIISHTSPVTGAITATESTRLRALSLYRRLLRGSQRMPTPNRQNYVLRKTRSEFRKHMSLTDVDEIDFQLRLADTNLDTVLVQAEHLSR